MIRALLRLFIIIIQFSIRCFELTVFDKKEIVNYEITFEEFKCNKDKIAFMESLKNGNNWKIYISVWYT